MNHYELLQQLEVELKEGDILFTSIPNFLYRAIEKGTDSPTSHVGIAIRQNNQWMVAESKVPLSRLSSLDNFVGRSANSWVSVKRLKTPLNDDQVFALKGACLGKLGRWYDFGFNYHSKGLFCSKFVYDAYLEACGIKIGQLETVEQLLGHCPVESIAFWRLWFCGFIPRNNTTVTPHSQYMDSQLREVDLKT